MSSVLGLMEAGGSETCDQYKRPCWDPWAQAGSGLPTSPVVASAPLDHRNSTAMKEPWGPEMYGATNTVRVGPVQKGKSDASARGRVCHMR